MEMLAGIIAVTPCGIGPAHAAEEPSITNSGQIGPCWLACVSASSCIASMCCMPSAAGLAVMAASSMSVIAPMLLLSPGASVTASTIISPEPSCTANPYVPVITLPDAATEPVLIVAPLMDQTRYGWLGSRTAIVRSTGQG